MSNVGKEKINIFEPYRNEFEYMYKQGAHVVDIISRFSDVLDEAGVSMDRRRKFIYELADFYQVKREGSKPDLDYESDEVQYLTTQVEKERQSRRISDSKANALSKQVGLENRLIDMLRAVLIASDPIEVSEVTVPDSVTTSEHNLVALLSDLHVGEVVKPSQVGGLDEYNLEVFDRRMNNWTNNLLYLTELKRAKRYVPKIEVFCLGDFVSGEIHDELIRTNEVHVFEQVLYAVKAVQKSLITLASQFDEVRVIGVSGNHGRNARKPYAKDKQTMSFDFLIYQILSMLLVNQKNIKFIIPETFFAFRNVLGTRFVALHGDGIKSTLGLPYYGLARMRARMQDMLGVDTPFDHMLLGHYHHFAQQDVYTINPSFKGADEYSVSGFFGANRPKQTLLTVHPEHGIVSTEHIFLDDISVNKPDLSPPPTWADITQNVEVWEISEFNIREI